MSLKLSVEDLTWEHPEAGMWACSVKGREGIEYLAILRYRQLDEVWEVLGTVDGSVAHRSEHDSRAEARLEAEEMFLRAITIRERTSP